MSSRCSPRVIAKNGIFFLLREVILYYDASSGDVAGHTLFAA